MKYFAVLLSGLLLVLIGSSPVTARESDGSSRRFAIVIGNNAPQGAARTALRFADDDAAATHQLLLEAGVESLLLTSFDKDSTPLARRVGTYGRPNRETLDRAIEEVSARIADALKAGERAELLVFYSGHGDVIRGEGFVALEGARFTRSGLQSLLERANATTNHVFIDACNSYYMVFDRGPGGAHEPFSGPAVLTPAQMAESGFVTSTSSYRPSHEWDRFGGGILSHEIRSGLRGAADADQDGCVTYKELAAFIKTANGDIPVEKYRPTPELRAPSGDGMRPILCWAKSAPVISFVPRVWGHFYIEDDHGVRVLDAHPSSEQSLQLHLPDQRPLHVIGDDGTTEFKIEKLGKTQVERLIAGPPTQMRGAAHRSFEHIFDSPFGISDVQAFQLSDPTGPHVSPRDVRGKRVIRAAAWTATAAAAVTAGVFGVLSLQHADAYRQEKRQLNPDDLSRKSERAEKSVRVFGSMAGATALAAATSLWITLKW